MKKYACLMSFAMVALLTFSAVADDKEEAKKEVKKGEKKNQVAQQLFKELGKVELTDDQKTKIEALGKEYGKILTGLNKAAAVTKDQRVKMGEARKAAAKEGKKGAELKKAAEEAAGLTDEQKTAMAKVAEIRKELMGKVKELLTDEQNAALGKKPAKGGEKKKKKKEAEKEAATATE